MHDRRPGTVSAYSSANVKLQLELIVSRSEVITDQNISPATALLFTCDADGSHPRLYRCAVLLSERPTALAWSWSRP